MADWVVKHNEQKTMAAGLLQDAFAIYESLHEPQPPTGGAVNDVSRELAPYTQQSVHLTGSLLQSAKAAQVNLEVIH